FALGNECPNAPDRQEQGAIPVIQFCHERPRMAGGMTLPDGDANKTRGIQDGAENNANACKA
ncbi:hypothetical protein ACQKO5_22380, partial [Novosphingobium subterraneum]|uniref:hypothetical protein n=1 Tax=Novosphingobium subterraneum TaxID=48936 RepID=UPI003D084E50